MMHDTILLHVIMVGPIFQLTNKSYGLMKDYKVVKEYIESIEGGNWWRKQGRTNATSKSRMMPLDINMFFDNAM